MHGQSASVPKGLISAISLVAAVGGAHVAGDARYDSGCWQNAGTVSGQDSFGFQLWEFDLNLWWCGDGTWITDYSWWVSVSTSSWSPLWQYEGLQGSNVLYGVGWSAVQVWAQGEFEQCAAWCFDSVYPEVTVFGGGNGDFEVW